MCNITFNKKTIEWEHEGILIKVIIHFWSKDYHAEMIEPYSVYFSGGHLMYMLPMVYVAIDDDEHEEPSHHRTKNIVPIVKENSQKWLRNKECNIRAERFAIGFSTEAFKKINIDDLIEKKLPIRYEKKLKKAQMKVGEISQKDYQLYLNNIREIQYSAEKEIILRVENYIAEHYADVLSNNPSYNIKDPTTWYSNCCCTNDERIIGEKIAINMLTQALKQQYEKETNASSQQIKYSS